MEKPKKKQLFTSNFLKSGKEETTFNFFYVLPKVTLQNSPKYAFQGERTQTACHCGSNLAFHYSRD